ncbi:family 16 glycoside hydrolase [Pedobacter psychrophilus]|uniref:family 16 glycoside hydrolase n=1 Tax=Pedobacter psychrophilus TaxID=1826909 RepID=UPI0009EF6548|nr:family 16 glycoside hydrolase [Pedobacter psychrophilus]
MHLLKTYFLLLFILAFTSSISLAQDNSLTKSEKQEGWKLLFDGKTSTGWKGAFTDNFPLKVWKIKDGVLEVDASGGAESADGGDIVTVKEYDNFELKIDFKLTKGANSGVKYFVSPQQATPSSPRSAYGLEFQLLDDAVHPDAKLGKSGNRTISSLYDLIPAIDNKPVKPIGEWNTLKIVSNGIHVEHWLNGIMVLTYERGSENFKSLVADSKYKDIPNFGLGDKGKILLQEHGFKVYYKNIKIKETKLNAYNKTGKLLKEMPAVVSFTYRHSFEKNFEATLDTIKNLGITNIEFSNLFKQKADIIRKMLDERGMECTSFGVSYDDIVKNIDAVGKNAKTLGASFVRVAWIPHDKTNLTIDITKQAVIDFNAAGKILKEKYGLIFCYHNHGFDMQTYNNQTFFDYIMTNTNPEYVSFELDILWAFHAGSDPVALMKKYGSRFKLMHVKDLRNGIVGNLTGATPVENDVAVGSGQINIPAVIKEAQNIGIKYFYIEDESKAVNLQVPVSLAFLKKL